MTQENKIGKNIKKLRQAKGLSQDRLSKAADVSYNSIIKLGGRAKDLGGSELEIPNCQRT